MQTVQDSWLYIVIYFKVSVCLIGLRCILFTKINQSTKLLIMIKNFYTQKFSGSSYSLNNNSFNFLSLFNLKHFITYLLPVIFKQSKYKALLCILWLLILPALNLFAQTKTIEKIHIWFIYIMFFFCQSAKS